MHHHFLARASKFITILYVLTLTVFLYPGSASADPQYFYVNFSTGSTANSGTNPDEPWPTLQYTMTQISGRGPGEYVVKVAAGTYVGMDTDSTIDPPDVGTISIEGDDREATVIESGGHESWTSGITINHPGVTIQRLVLKDFQTAIEIIDANPKIFNNRLENNNVGIWIAASSGSWMPDIKNNVIVGSGGTGIYLSSGGQLEPIIFHNTIDGFDTGIQIDINAADTPEIRYNSITDYSVYGISCMSGSPDLYHNNVHSAAGDHYYGCSGPDDFHQTPGYTGGGEYSLRGDSALIDQIGWNEGDPETRDHLGVSRPQGNGYDIGAYEYPTLQTITVPILGGSTAADYQMTGPPLEPVDPRATVVLGPLVGDYDPAQIRIGHWNPETQSYEEYPFFGEVNAGGSGWVLSRTAREWTVTGYIPPTVFIEAMGGPGHEIHLDPGWNQAANPFPFDIDLRGDLAMVSDGSNYIPLLGESNTITLNKAYIFKNGGYHLTDHVKMTQGFWIKNTTSTTAYLVIRAVPYDTEAAGGNGLRPLSAEDESPPPPPGGYTGGEGGGGGGCFIGSMLDME